MNFFSSHKNFEKYFILLNDCLDLFGSFGNSIFIIYRIDYLTYQSIFSILSIFDWLFGLTGWFPLLVGICIEMPSSQMPAFCNPAMWSYGMMQWQQPPVQAQHYPFQMHAVPYPVMMPRMSTNPWFPADNYTSLPPKAKPESEDLRNFSPSKPARRFSDPGPDVTNIPTENTEDSSSVNNKQSFDEDDVLEPAEAQMFLGMSLTKSFKRILKIFLVSYRVLKYFKSF